MVVFVTCSVVTIAVMIAGGVAVGFKLAERGEGVSEDQGRKRR